MKQTPKPTSPVSSPYPGLQAVLPRLRSIGANSENTPVFSEREEVEEYLDDHNGADRLHIVPVWAINHTDLMRSEIVNWTFTRWLN